VAHRYNRAVTRDEDEPPLAWGTPDAEPARAAEPEALTVSQMVTAVKSVLAHGFPGPVWVVGETVKVYRHANGHIFLDLVDHEREGSGRNTIKLKIWNSKARTLFGPRGRLRGFELADSLVVRLQVSPDFYGPSGQLSFTVEDVDPDYTLGRLDRERRELLERLAAEGADRRNKERLLPSVPLVLGLVTALDSAAYADVLRTLRDGGVGFRILCCDARMQGEDTSRTVRAALRTLAARGPDCILLVRGGGGRTDLMWFDREDIARAIADCPVPVLTGIGHEIDVSVADVVAHRSFKTPTALAEFLVQTARQAREHVEDCWSRGLEHAQRRLLEAGDTLLDTARELRRGATDRTRDETQRLLDAGRRLRAGTEAALAQRGERLIEARAALRGGRHVQQLAAQAERLAQAGPRLQRGALAALLRREGATQTAQARLRALDPANVLRRGYAWLRRADGSLLKDAAAARAGEPLAVVLRDGELDVQAGAARPRPT
jgi:exodeoxyribonuclease VII large subunit